MPGQAKHAARDSAKAAWPLRLMPGGLGGAQWTSAVTGTAENKAAVYHCCKTQNKAQ